MKEGIQRKEISEFEKNKILEYSSNLCKLVYLKRKKLITEKEYEILKEKIKKFNNNAE